MDAIVEEGGFANMDAFRDSLDEELRNEPIIKNSKDMGSIAKMAVDNHRMVGQKTEEFISSIPANGDDPAAIDTVYGKLGWPGAEGQYEVERPEAVEGLEYSEEQEASFLEAAKEMRLNGTQVNKLIAMQNEWQKAQLAQDLEAATKANDALKAEWGDKYEANKNEVKAILEKSGDESLVKLFNETELGSHAGFVKLIHALGKGSIEATAPGKGDPADAGAVKKNEALDKIAANYQDTKFMDAYSDKRHEDYEKNQLEMEELHRIAHGEAVVG